MDPWLEHPAIWADIHNSLIVAISDALTPNLVPEFVARLGQRVFILRETDPICPKREKVDFAHLDQLKEIYLEIRDVKTRSVVTVIEVLSPANKVDIEGRRQYIQKRRNVLSTLTSFIEIDLLRAGEPMDQPPQRPATDYRILVSRGFERHRSLLYFFGIRQTIPSIPIPLLPGMEEPLLDLNQLVHSLYTRARFDLTLDYNEPPVPPLKEEDAGWAKEMRLRAVLKLLIPDETEKRSSIFRLPAPAFKNFCCLFGNFENAPC